VITQFTDVSIFSINLVTALGLGLAIDYSLFIVSRFREEIRAAMRELHSAPSVHGWSFCPATLTATPFLTVVSSAQVSGQSCGQAPCTTRVSDVVATGRSVSVFTVGPSAAHAGARRRTPMGRLAGLWHSRPRAAHPEELSTAAPNPARQPG